jgi:hypothetical protein
MKIENKRENTKKILEENKKKYISVKNIPKHPGNCRRLVRED